MANAAGTFNRDAALKPVNTLRCPSFDPAPRFCAFAQPVTPVPAGDPASYPASGGNYGSSIDYGAITGDPNTPNSLYSWMSETGRPNVQTNPTFSYGGSSVAMPLNKARKILDITDGTSNTVIVVESAGRSDKKCILKNCSAVGSWESGVWAGSCNGVAPTGSNFDGTFNSNTGPCTMNCTNMGDASSRSNIYSWHAGGSNMLFAGGSVRFVGEQIPWTTLGRMLTSSDGEVVDASAY